MRTILFSNLNMSMYQLLDHNIAQNNLDIYIFRNIKTPNHVLFLLCVCLIYQSWMFVVLMMPRVGPMIRQYNVFYSILFYSITITSVISNFEFFSTTCCWLTCFIYFLLCEVIQHHGYLRKIYKLIQYLCTKVQMLYTLYMYVQKRGSTVPV